MSPAQTKIGKGPWERLTRPNKEELQGPHAWLNIALSLAEGGCLQYIHDGTRNVDEGPSPETTAVQLEAAALTLAKQTVSFSHTEQSPRCQHPGRVKALVVKQACHTSENRCKGVCQSRASLFQGCSQTPDSGLGLKSNVLQRDPSLASMPRSGRA